MESYSVPREAQNVFLNGIIFNPLHSSAPEEIKEAAHYIEYLGSNSPSIPINWRFAESIAALKGFEGAMLNVLLKKKYGIDYQEIAIHTYVLCRAQLLHAWAQQSWTLNPCL